MTKKPELNKHQSELLIQKLSHAISYLAVEALKPAERNPRTHSRKQIRQIADSFSRFGVITPLIIDAENRIVAGHGRWAAAKQLGIDLVPCLQITHLSKADLKALAITDNRIALNAGWDEELLALELQEIKLLDPGLDLAVTGIEDAEIEVLIGGMAPHLNTFGLGQTGRYRTNVWSYRGQNSFGAGRDAALAMHPTVKPVAMIKDAILDVSTRGDIVLDLFGGSGSTLIAAHRTGRRGYLCEIDPVYCDCIIRRWETIASDEATLEATGQTFEEVLTERRGGNGP